MNMRELIAALGVRAEPIGPELEPALIWGEECFIDWGSQLVVTLTGQAAVRYEPKDEGTALHEACHALFGEQENETRVFAYEWLVASELLGESREHWVNAFSRYSVTNTNGEGGSVLDGTMDVSDHAEWTAALAWLEKKGFTVGWKPVFGLGQGDLEEGIRSLIHIPREHGPEIERWGLDYCPHVGPEKLKLVTHGRFDRKQH